MGQTAAETEDGRGITTTINQAFIDHIAVNASQHDAEHSEGTFVLVLHLIEEINALVTIINVDIAIKGSRLIAASIQVLKAHDRNGPIKEETEVQRSFKSDEAGRPVATTIAR